MTGPTGLQGSTGPTGPQGFGTGTLYRTGASFSRSFATGTTYTLPMNIDTTFDMPVSADLTTINSNLDVTRFSYVSATPTDYAIQFTPPASGAATWLYGTMTIGFEFIATSDGYVSVAMLYRNTGSPPSSGAILQRMNYAMGNVSQGQSQYGNLVQPFNLSVPSGGPPIIFYPLINNLSSSTASFTPLSLSFSICVLAP
jgi:hypothetical protein